MCTRLSLAVLGLGLFVSGHPGPGFAIDAPPPDDRWIIDTDMAYDDQLAIMIALRHPRAKIVAISVVGTGAAHCPQAATTAARLVDLAERDAIPAACGPEFPLDGFHSLPTFWRDAADALVPTDVRESRNEPPPSDSVDLIIETVRSADGPVSILALGPHTNLAPAFERAPDIVGKVREIVAMAGAIHAAGNLSVPGVTDDLANRTAEWNAFIDPIATKSVVETGLPIRLVTLDSTSQVNVDSTFLGLFNNLSEDSVTGAKVLALRVALRL
ncbi:MAG: nucleoside hydrolase [Hyphomicrobiales bacterium]|nr:nucleoside hydrolase [Hyphomicrobiales bacterium]